jgi:hypothetical protein
MKSCLGVFLALGEGALAYLWLALGYEAVGRVLIFYLWAWTILVFFIAGIAAHPKFVPSKVDKSPRPVRYFLRAAAAGRVLGLAAIGRPVLAGLYLVGVVLMYLVLHSPSKPSAESKEGV